MAILDCLPPFIHLSTSDDKSPKHPNICSKPITYQTETLLELYKETIHKFAMDLIIMEKVDLENGVGCRKPCTQTLYNVKMKSNLNGNFDKNWINIAFSDEIQACQAS